MSLTAPAIPRRPAGTVFARMKKTVSGWTEARLGAQARRIYLEPLNAAIARLSASQLIVLCLTMTVAIALCEYSDRLRLSFVLLYIVPIWIASWYSGLRTALILNVLCVPIWNTAITMRGGPTHNLAAFGMNRFLLFSLFALAVVRLKTFSHNLEELAAKRAQALLSEMAERERLERELLDISDREQQRIGQDLHDGLCQQLAATAMLSHVHARKLKEASEIGSAQRIAELVEQSIWLARCVAKGLYPVEANNQGLMEAFEDFAATTSELFSVKCRFECHLPVLVDDPEVAGNLFRIGQEAVSNAIKHGRASEIQIALAQNEDGLELCISDNGCGFDCDRQWPSGGMGLRSMAVRAKVIGGKFQLSRGLEGGIMALCFVPERLEA